MNLEALKSLLPVFAAVAALGGFYYTTQHRLDHLEVQVTELEEKIGKLTKKVNKINKETSQ